MPQLLAHREETRLFLMATVNAHFNSLHPTGSTYFHAFFLDNDTR